MVAIKYSRDDLEGEEGPMLQQTEPSMYGCMYAGVCVHGCLRAQYGCNCYLNVRFHYPPQVPHTCVAIVR
jgi:hypothetical protein